MTRYTNPGILARSYEFRACLSRLMTLLQRSVCLSHLLAPSVGSPAPCCAVYSTVPGQTAGSCQPGNQEQVNQTCRLTSQLADQPASGVQYRSTNLRALLPFYLLNAWTVSLTQAILSSVATDSLMLYTVAPNSKRARLHLPVLPVTVAFKRSNEYVPKVFQPR